MPPKTSSSARNNMGKGGQGQVAAFSPAGVKSWIELSDNIQNVKQLKQRAVDALPWTPGQHVDNVQLILDGRTLEETTPLSKCTFLPSSAIHLVLKVHGG